MNIQLAIADDHPMIAEGVKNILRSYPHIDVVATYATGKALLDGLQASQPDVLLLDIHFPDTTGNELVRTIAPLYPAVKIIAFTSEEDPFEVQDMIQNGCTGYVLKTADKAVLAEAIEQVYAGATFLEPSLKEALVQSMLNPNGKKPLKLTAKEQQVLEFICQGLTNMDIGEKLFLSHRTIEHYRVALYEKFGVSNTASLVKYAVQNKLVR